MPPWLTGLPGLPPPPQKPTSGVLSPTGNGVWIAVSQSGTNRVMRSADNGQNWSAVVSAETHQWQSVAYGNGVWVAVSDSGANRVMRSPDPASSSASGAGAASARAKVDISIDLDVLELPDG